MLLMSPFTLESIQGGVYQISYFRSKEFISIHIPVATLVYNNICTW